MADEIKIKTGIDQKKVQVNVDYDKMDNDTFVENIKKIKTVGSGHPTYNPRDFKEQFYFEDNGSMWVNINNTWKEFTPI